MKTGAQLRRSTLALAAALAAGAGVGRAGEDVPVDAPIVVELFTSQSCSSCLGATAFFNDLAKRGDIVALGWHVDYWNRLRTAEGAWTDPFSAPEYSERQRRYNLALRDKGTIYTPQMVIDGEAETIGSRPELVLPLVEECKRRKPAAIDIAAHRSDNKLMVDIGPNDGGEAFLVAFEPEVRTQIKSGENAGQSVTERNVVTGVTPLGAVSPDGAQVEARVEKGAACAIILQEPGQGKITAARYCPA